MILQTNNALADDGDHDGSTPTGRAITAITDLCEHVTDNQTRQTRDPGTGLCQSMGRSKPALTTHEL